MRPIAGGVAFNGKRAMNTGANRAEPVPTGAIQTSSLPAPPPSRRAFLLSEGCRPPSEMTT